VELPDRDPCGMTAAALAAATPCPEAGRAVPGVRLCARDALREAGVPPGRDLAAPGVGDAGEALVRTRASTRSRSRARARSGSRSCARPRRPRRAAHVKRVVARWAARTA
jgi:hypothetical protein